MEGTFVNHQLHGFGIQYCAKSGRKICEGHHENGLMLSGKICYENDHQYEGELNKESQCHGRGKLYEKGNLVYDGLWKENKQHGQGTIYKPPNEIKYYEGAFFQG